MGEKWCFIADDVWPILHRKMPDYGVYRGCICMISSKLKEWNEIVGLVVGQKRLFWL